jgi:Tfp pilus assembly protein PilF
MDQEFQKIYFKTIVQGRLEFGTAKSFDKVYKMFVQRSEQYHKNQVIFTEDELFDEAKLTMEIPRFVGQISEKVYKNTIMLLTYCSQFAVTGSIRAWMSDGGKIMHYNLMEPVSDKVAVRSFLKGRKLVKQKGKEEEAISLLNKAIEKYDRHAQAYERRAKVCFLMKNYHDALRDYTKAIGIDPTIPTAFFGRARIHKINKDWELAIEDFNQTLKKSIALQPIYWKARKLKAECHIKLKQYDLAEFDLKLYSNRKFGEDDINNKYVRWALFQYGSMLIQREEFVEAIVQLNKALETPQQPTSDIKDAEIYRMRGIAKKGAGKNGYLKDIKDAVKLGDKKAKTLLASF